MSLKSRWQRWACATVGLLMIAFSLPLARAASDYLHWRNSTIAWDIGAIERLCGGDTDAERLLDIRFVRQWEYKALKKTAAGKHVWLHWRLSKRHCGNWSLVDPTQAALIRPFQDRFPNGAPKRNAVNCLGLPIDESESWPRRDQLLRVP